MADDNDDDGSAATAADGEGASTPSRDGGRDLPAAAVVGVSVKYWIPDEDDHDEPAVADDSGKNDAAGRAVPSTAARTWTSRDVEPATVGLPPGQQAVKVKDRSTAEIGFLLPF